MNLLDDKPKYSDRTMTQTIVFVVGLLFLAFLFAMQEVLIGIFSLFIWLGLLIWIGHAKN